MSFPFMTFEDSLKAFGGSKVVSQKKYDQLMNAARKLITAATIVLENAECRGDEDCDHCVSTNILEEFYKQYPKENISEKV